MTRILLVNVIGIDIEAVDRLVDERLGFFVNPNFHFYVRIKSAETITKINNILKDYGYKLQFTENLLNPVITEI